MSEQVLKETLAEAVLEFLEQAAFVFPEPVDTLEDIQLSDDDYIIVSLDFKGVKSGWIKMILAKSFCAELTSNLLGEDLDDDYADQNDFDSAKEMLNIIAGQLLTRVFGERALFNLNPPQVEDVDNGAIYDQLSEYYYSVCMVNDCPVIAMAGIGEKQEYEHKSSCS